MKRILLIVCVLVCVLAGCTTTKPVVCPPSIKTDISVTQSFDSISRDHVRYVWLTGDTKHDTLHITDSIYIDRWRVRTDSIVRIDSIPVIKEVVVPQSSGSKFLRNSGIALWVIIGVFLLAVIIGVILKFAK